MDDAPQEYSLKKLLAIPLAALVVFTVIASTWKYAGLPTDETVMNFARQYYSQYGYLIVFVGAFVEGLLLINWYFPGSLIAVIGVTLSREVGINPVIVVIMIILAFFCTSIINYGLGRFGWYRLLLKLGLEKPLENIRKRTEDKGLKIIFTTYIHPNLGALTATSAGILRMPFKKFALYSALATVIWDTFWGLAAYFVGQPILAIISTWTIVAFFALTIIWKLFWHFRRKSVDAKPAQ